MVARRSRVLFSGGPFPGHALVAWFASLTVVAICLLSLGCGRSDLDVVPVDGSLPDGSLAEAGPEAGDVGGCNPVTCPAGCCSESGTCETGTVASACGNGGARCATCSGGATCSAQTCTASSCNATTCPTGCCDTTGTCQAGDQLASCGTAGATCENCTKEGFQQCDPSTHACDTPVTMCTPGNCATGCCQRGPSGSLCIDGLENATCGTGGEACIDCAQSGQVCDVGTRACVAPQCGPMNCGGCCFGDQCIVGTATNACGQGGQQCQNCGSNGSCENGTCVTTTPCSGSTCTGCCDQSGRCESGTSESACGNGGSACVPCPPNLTCVGVGQGGLCVPSQGCSPATCSGCCDGTGECQPGENPNACGSFGQPCFACPPASGCVTEGAGSFCEPLDGGFDASACGPFTCSGCCDSSGVCQPGDAPFACGFGGQQCFACPIGATCDFTFCQLADGGLVDGSVCGPENCGGCCDNAGTCQTGGTVTACGKGGLACTICPPQATCTAGACQSQTGCNASNCSGCCDANNICEAGFVATACGSGGNICIDCTEENADCNTSASPRACTGPTMMCPQAYPSCPSGTITPTPATQSVCPQSDLSNAGAACQSGPNTTSCVQFFQFESTQNPPCASCLSTFDIDFDFDDTGIFLCVAPFVDSTCNQETGCTDDCVHKSCSSCPAGNVDGCEADATSNQCAIFFDNDECVFEALEGQASFCDPTGSFGAWLQTVGQFYCGQ